METRKESLSALKLCRFCLSQDGSLTSLYDRSLATRDAVTLPLKIMSCISVEVFPSDKMPCFICKRCKYFMDICYDYKQICRQADETIMQYIQNGTALESITWKPSLVKCFRETAKPLETNVIKTVLEGGATVQMTSQEVFDSDEDDELSFNIKIEDSPKGPKNRAACTKTPKNDELAIVKPQAKQNVNEEFGTLGKLTRHVRSHAGGNKPYPCKYCNKSFLKSHHYTRHIRLKHRETSRKAKGPFGASDPYRCEQCEDSFGTQDELIYHSAIHATQNLICPLCQEKFDSVDAVTAHIKTHVNGTEFMCELCELVFTTQEKLEVHLRAAHEEELLNEQEEQDDEQDDIDLDEDDDNDMHVKEEDGQMVVEINKPDNYMLSAKGDKVNNTISEESEPEVSLTSIPAMDSQNTITPATPPEKVVSSTIEKPFAKAAEKPNNNKLTASILRKAEEIKRKAVQVPQESPPTKKDKPNRVESSSSAGASEKSLRLLEKELQDLKRTNSRNEAAKTPVKPTETIKNRRAQIQTSTPKTRVAEEKRFIEEKKVLNKTPPVEKKQPERRIITKENKEPKENKETKSNNTTVNKEEKEKEVKSVVVKNGVSEKSATEEVVRRSSRPSKVKDYAKLIQDRSQESEEEEDVTDDDEEYKEPDKIPENRKSRRSSIKTVPTPTAPAPTPSPTATPVRRRGRPRKGEQSAKKGKKADLVDGSVNISQADNSEAPRKQLDTDDAEHNISNKNNEDIAVNSTTVNAEPAVNSSSILMSPSGKSLKKVPMRALPPGVKPLPLPVNARPMPTGELCEMQIGKKLVKVQKIVMTKAEVEAMTKKGLVEMKDGTMVLKQGIKLPSSDAHAIKSTLIGEKGKISAAFQNNLNKPSDLPCLNSEN